MSVTVDPGETIVLDPSDVRVVQFDWDTENLATSAIISISTFTITAVRQADILASLTKDNPSIFAGNRKTQVRLIASTASVGDEYELANKVTTNESPTQDKEQSVRILIQNR